MTTKVKSFGQTKLTNAEHLNFHLETKMLITTCTPEKISAVTEMPLYEAAIQKEVEIVNRQTASALTADLEAKDKERDELLSYLFAMIDAAKNAPIPAMKEAHKYLAPVIQPYRGIAHEIHSRESAEIVGLVNDLTAVSVVTYVTGLNLLTIVQSLSALNEEYMELDLQRTSEMPSKADTRAVRAEIDKHYESIIDKANATVLLAPNDEAVMLVDNLNKLIDKTNADHNRRKAKHEDPDLPTEQK